MKRVETEGVVKVWAACAIKPVTSNRLKAFTDHLAISMVAPSKHSERDSRASWAYRAT